MSAADGLFGTYFQNMIGTGPCAPGYVLTGFSNSSDSSHGTRQCLDIATLLAQRYSGQVAPTGQALLGFETNGNLKFGDVNWTRTGANIYYTGANVGIGITNPTYKLEVAGTIGITAQEDAVLQLNSMNPMAPGYWRIWEQNINGNLIIGSGSSNQFIFSKAGNLGIGTTSPSAPLSINADTDQKILLTDTSVGGHKMQFQVGSDHALIASDSFITLNPGSDLRYGDPSGEAMRVNTNGNVGIGTSVPTAKLEVSDDIIVHGYRIGSGIGGANNPSYNNILFGKSSLSSNTTGNANTAIGTWVLQANQAGQWNTSIGFSSMTRNIDGSYNTAFGGDALNYNQYGNYNTAIGYLALVGSAGSSISNNVGLGAYAGRTISSGDNNTFIGQSAGRNFQIGSNNIALGANTNFPSTTGSNQLNIGNLIYGTGMIGNGRGNIGIGTSAPTAKLEVNGQVKINGGVPGIGKVLMSDATGLASWSATGPYPCRVTGSGANNSACYSGVPGTMNVPLSANTTGVQNAAFGYSSLSFNKTGGQNTAIGIASMNDNVSGSWNTAVGGWSLGLNIFGWQNTVQGAMGLYNNTSGSNNVAIGYRAGHNLTSGNNNIALGANTNFPSTTGSNQLNIGNLIYGNGMIGWGNGNVGIGTPDPTSKLELYTRTASTVAQLTSPVNQDSTLWLYSDIGNNQRNGWAILKQGIDPNYRGNLLINYDDARGHMKKNVMTITPSGNVGIGTVSPTAKLDVAGEIHGRNGYGHDVYMGGDNYANDFEIGTTTPSLRDVVLWNRGSNSSMNLTANDVYVTKIGKWVSELIKNTPQKPIYHCQCKLGDTLYDQYMFGNDELTDAYFGWLVYSSNKSNTSCWVAGDINPFGVNREGRLQCELQ